jgi:hypothetical protein
MMEGLEEVCAALRPPEGSQGGAIGRVARAVLEAIQARQARGR